MSNVEFQVHKYWWGTRASKEQTFNAKSQGRSAAEPQPKRREELPQKSTKTTKGGQGREHPTSNAERRRGAKGVLQAHKKFCQKCGVFRHSTAKAQREMP